MEKWGWHRREERGDLIFGGRPKNWHQNSAFWHPSLIWVSLEEENNTIIAPIFQTNFQQLICWQQEKEMLSFVGLFWKMLLLAWKWEQWLCYCKHTSEMPPFLTHIKKESKSPLKWGSSPPHFGKNVPPLKDPNPAFVRLKIYLFAHFQCCMYHVLLLCTLLSTYCCNGRLIYGGQSISSLI